MKEMAKINPKTRSGRAQYLRNTRRIKKKIERRFSASIRYLFRRQVASIKRVTSKGDPARAEAAAKMVVDYYAPQMRKVFLKYYTFAARQAARNSIAHLKGIKQESTVDNFIAHFVEAETARKVKHINFYTKYRIRLAVEKGIKDGLGEPEIAKLIREVAPRIMSPQRSLTIARTEVHTAFEEATRAVAADLPAEIEKTWLATIDGRVRDAHAAMHGKTVRKNGTFTLYSNSGFPVEMQGPGDIDAPAELVINCRCTIIFVPK